MTPPLVTRFAPSPTGHLHIGGARSALFCWAFAKKNGGRFMIRIEDTDQSRSSDESARGILEDLAWLGIEWDDGPKLTMPDGRVIGANARDVGSYFQAQRLPIYNKYLQQLIEQGKAYPAFESSEELEAKRKAAVAAKQTYRYDRASFHSIPTAAARFEAMAKADAEKKPYVIRFFAPHEEVVVHDQVLGDVKYAAGEMDDFVIRKADGFPIYHFAVVIDDETMGVTHVMRAQEHLNNTPRHVALQKALGFRVPVYAHMPLICNMDNSKMSKRDKAKAARKAAKDAIAKSAGGTGLGGTAVPAVSSPVITELAKATAQDPKVLSDFLAGENDNLDVAQALGAHFKVALPEIEIWDFRQSGYLPEAIINFVSLLGWNPGLKTADGKDLEKFDAKFLAEHFSIDRLGKTSSKFDRVKLLSFNADAIAALSNDDFIRRFDQFLAEYEPEARARVGLATAESSRVLRILSNVIRPRAKTLRDALKPCSFLFLKDDAVPFDPAAVAKNLHAPSPDGTPNQGLALLRDFRSRLAGIDPFDPEPIHAMLESLAKEKALPNMGPIAQAIRVAIAGVAVSPPLGETLAALGKASSLARIDRCIQLHGA
jgi:glutamyl/glutaminyl-tRNA synthetase